MAVPAYTQISQTDRRWTGAIAIAVPTSKYLGYARRLSGVRETTVTGRMSGKALAAGLAAKSDDPEPVASAIPLTCLSNDVIGLLPA
jgi:hypothetical protein